MIDMQQEARAQALPQLGRTLGVSHDTAWLMLHKLREAMGTHEEEYLLKGIVELDDVFFGGPPEGGKRGRGTNKTPAIIAFSLNEDGNPIGNQLFNRLLSVCASMTTTITYSQLVGRVPEASR